MAVSPQGLIAQVIEAYTARCCHRIGAMIELTISKHPEATSALQELASMVKMYSLVFGPGHVDHPLMVETKVDKPKELHPNTARILEMKRKDPSISNAEIARIIGCDRTNVVHTLKKHRDLL